MTMTIITMMRKTNKNFNTHITYVEFSLSVLCPPLTFSVGCHMLVPAVFVYTSSWLSYTILIWTVIKKNEKTKTKINYLFHVIENNCQRSLMGLRSIHNYSITIYFINDAWVNIYTKTFSNTWSLATTRKSSLTIGGYQVKHWGTALCSILSELMRRRSSVLLFRRSYST